MKPAVIIVRSLMGLMFLFASITYFFKLITPPPPEGAMKAFNDGLEASRYLLPTAKVVELLSGLAFLTGRFVPLASVLIAPIIVNIVMIHAFLDPRGLPIALALAAGNVFLAYVNRERYRALLKP